MFIHYSASYYPVSVLFSLRPFIQGHSLLAGFHTLPALAEVLQLTVMFSFFISCFLFFTGLGGLALIVFTL